MFISCVFKKQMFDHALSLHIFFRHSVHRVLLATLALLWCIAVVVTWPTANSYFLKRDMQKWFYWHCAWHFVPIVLCDTALVVLTHAASWVWVQGQGPCAWARHVVGVGVEVDLQGSMTMNQLSWVQFATHYTPDSTQTSLWYTSFCVVWFRSFWWWWCWC